MPPPPLLRPQPEVRDEDHPQRTRHLQPSLKPDGTSPDRRAERGAGSAPRAAGCHLAGRLLARRRPDGSCGSSADHSRGRLLQESDHALRGSRPGLGRTTAHRARGARRRRAAAPRRERVLRRRDRRRPRAVRRGGVPGRDRRPAGGDQRDRQPAGRGRAQQGLPGLRGGRAPDEHRQVRVPRRTARRPARRAPRPRPRPELGRRQACDRGLSARRDRRAVPARPHAEVQGQARAHPR